MVLVCPAFTCTIRMAKYNTVLFVPSDDFSIPLQSMNSGPQSAVMDLNSFLKVFLPKDDSSLFILQRPNGPLAFGIFLIIPALVFRSVCVSAHSNVEEAQLFTESISLRSASERLFIQSGLFEMLPIAHPMRENFGFRLFPLYFLPLFGRFVIEIP